MDTDGLVIQHQDIDRYSVEHTPIRFPLRLNNNESLILSVWWSDDGTKVNTSDHRPTIGKQYLGPVLLTLLRHVAKILANGRAAFFESCNAIGWNSCDVSQKR